MKALFYIVIIICLPLLVWFQYHKYKRLNPPSQYTGVIHQEIDKEYFDPDEVEAYYAGHEELGTYARHIWKKHGVDVLSDLDKEKQTEPYVKTFQKLKARQKILEDKLIESSGFKKQGMSNDDIKEIHEGGDAGEIRYKQLLNNKVLAKSGDKSSMVFEIQKELEKKGYQLSVDGEYRLETVEIIKDFQQKNGLFETGVVDALTLQKLTHSKTVGLTQ